MVSASAEPVAPSSAAADADQANIFQYYVSWFAAMLIVLILARKVLSGKACSSNSSVSATKPSPQFVSFQRVYLLVYLIMMMADWMQGPYVYALYKHYGYSIGDIGLLFIVGFGSSMIMGTVIGSAADKYGRKKLCLLFGVLYSLSCLTKHVKDFKVLLVGRLLGGISTSILFSSFESWMVHEHHAASFADELLGDTFSLCTSGNGLVAIAAGVIAGIVRDWFGPVAPFDCSLVLLVIGSVIIALRWNENTGNANIELSTTMINAWQKMMKDPKIVYLGVIQSFFEGAMYIFVFMWTPALESTSPFHDQHISHGWIFATFMICVLVGSTLFQFFLSHNYRVERTSLYMILVAAVSLLLPAFAHNHHLRYLAFLVFEVCVGLFWPSLGFLRSHYVPEDVRATTMNFFRMPLNLIVILVLSNIGTLSDFQVFSLSFIILIPAFVCQYLLLRMSLKPKSVSSESSVALAHEKESLMEMTSATTPIADKATQS